MLFQYIANKNKNLFTPICFASCDRKKQPPEVVIKKGCFWKFCKSRRKTLVLQSFLIKLLTVLKKEAPVQVLSFEFCKVFRSTFLKSTSHDCFWIEYKHNNTKMIRINVKHIISYPISSLATKCCSSYPISQLARP